MKVYLLTGRRCAGDEFIIGIYANLESAKISTRDYLDGLPELVNNSPP